MLNSLKKRKNLLILAALIFFQLVLVSFQVPLNGEESLFEKIIISLFCPVQHGVISISQQVKRNWRRYFYLRDVNIQNEELNKEIFFLRQENRILKNLLLEFGNKKEVQERLEKTYENILPCRVISMDASNYYKSVIVNKGISNGVKKNMIVVDKHGNLVGHIIEPISFREARVQLITDNSCGVSVFSHEKKILGILTGDGKGQCILKYILVTEENINNGDKILTSGFDEIFPPEINVGKVTSIKSTAGLFKEIEVKPYFDFRELDKLAIIKINLKDNF